ncbi:MAG: hypothetical protein AAFU65_10990, partial [Pseudomonadota bacterium]
MSRTSTGSVAIFEGTAPSTWLATLKERLGTVDGLRGSDLRGLTDASVVRYNALRDALSARRVLYSGGLRMSSAQNATLP